MSSYKIKPYSFKQASKLNVKIQPSSNPKKKIDVYDMKGNKLASIGDINYKDYPTYMIEKGDEYASLRRKAYHLRHSKESSKKNSASFYAKEILW